jgi:uncharacterized protein involved in exopolysaccharide biosynthesis
MTDSFDPLEYLEYLRNRWRFTAIAVILAAAAAAAASLVLPKQYTAVATLVVEPPAGDPRGATAVSPVYLESLKSYEALASSNSLFARACEKFHLLDDKPASSLESLKRRVLQVDKPKDTNVLEISVTLPNPTQAQELVKYLAEETVALDRATAHSDDQALLENSRRQVEAAQKDLDDARTEGVAVASSEPVLDNEVQALEARASRAEEQRMEANLLLAESSARGDQESAAANRAGVAALTGDAATLRRDLDAKSAALAALRARRQRADNRIHNAEGIFERAARRADEVSSSVAYRTEQLHVVDPGVVPERPSFPNLPLAVISAVVIAAMLCLVWLTFQFGLMRNRERPAHTGLRVASSAGR